MLNWEFSSVENDASGVSEEELSIIQNIILEAGAVWGRYLDTDFDVTIEIDLSITNLGSSTLARAGTFFGNSGNVVNDIIVGQAVTLNELSTGEDLTPVGGAFNPSGGDSTFIVNADVLDRLFFEPNLTDRDSEIPAGLFDFFTIALHELGHILGILSFRAGSNQLLSNSGTTFDSLISLDENGDPSFNGAAAAEALNGAEFNLTSGTTSHFGDPNGNALDQALDSFALLSSTLAPQQRGYVSALEIGVIQDIGGVVATNTDGDDTLYGFERVDLSEYYPEAQIPFLPTEALNLASGNDNLFGAAGNDRLNGLSGDDTLLGGLGNDTLNGGEGNDVFIYRRGDGDDLITSETISNGIDRLVLRDIEREDVTGRVDGNNLVLEINPANGGAAGTITLQGGVNADVDALLDSLLFDDGTIVDLAAFFEDTSPIPSEAVTIISGSSDGDFLQGGALSEEIFGGAGHDRLVGDQGNDSISGGNDSDVVLGGAGEDTLNGDGGADLLLGADGVDVLNGGDGEDILSGGNGSDVLNGGAGSDIIYGVDDDTNDMNDTFSDNFLFGGTGNDLLFGGSSNDQLSGEEGDDIINGGAGEDRIIGGKGNDILIGGAGADTFVFETNHGTDTLSDFEVGVDVLDFSAFGFSSVEEVLSFATEIGSSTYFDFGNGDKLSAFNVTTTEISEDILF